MQSTRFDRKAMVFYISFVMLWLTKQKFEENLYPNTIYRGIEGLEYEAFAISNTTWLKLLWEFYIFVLLYGVHKIKYFTKDKKYINSYDNN